MRRRSGRSSGIVDDSTVIQKIGKRILEEMDFQIMEAEDGEKARAAGRDPARLEHAGHGWLRIPGQSAPHARRRRAKVVFCTTENGIDHIARALNAGAHEYIMKPFDKDIMAAKFQEVGLIQVAVPA